MQRVVLRYIIISVLSFSLWGCSGMEKSEISRLKKNNEEEEFIYRKQKERLYKPFALVKQKREQYPWEEKYFGKIPKITKEYFRCKGNRDNPEKKRTNNKNQTIYYHDCGGIELHSLPIHDNKEFIYPILIDLLNYIQKETKQRVVITCGHRCPKHNDYADSSRENRSSKHLIGAEVDFYVEGMEKQPKKAIELIMRYYLETEDYKGKKEYQHFFPSKHSNAWHNKEIAISIAQEDEKRDFDNRHPYPYITIHVRYNREKNTRVLYNWQKAHRGFLRW